MRCTPASPLASEGTDVSETEGRTRSRDERVIDVRDATPAIDVRSLDLGGDVVIITDREGTIVDVNDAFVRVTGYSRREAIGQTPRLLSSGFQDQEFYAELWRTLTRGEVWEGQLVDRRRDGQLRTYHATISPVKDSAGRITHFVAVERDMTSDLARQAALGTTGLVHTDQTGNCVYADRRSAMLLDTEPPHLLGRGLTDQLDPDDAAQLREMVGLTTESGRRYRLDVRLRATGEWRHLELAPLTVASGAVIGAACAIEDLAAEVELRRELERREALLNSVLDALPDPVAVAADDGTVLALNRAWRQAHREDPDDEVLAASVGDDVESRARRAAEQGDERATALLAELRRLRTTGQDQGPTRRPRGDPEDGAPETGPGIVVTPLAWEEGGAVLRLPSGR